MAIHQGNFRFLEALDHRKYCQADKSSQYNDEIGRTIAMRVKGAQVQVRSQVLNQIDLPSIISSLPGLESAFDTSKTSEAVALCLLHNMTKCLVAAALNPRIKLRFNLQELQREGTVTLYSEAFNYMLVTYSTDDSRAEQRRWCDALYAT